MPAIADVEMLGTPSKVGRDENILCIDVGGTLIKAAVVDASGSLVSGFLRMPTPKPAVPEAVIAVIGQLVEPLPQVARISVGFPGVVAGGRIITAPNLGTPQWKDFNLAEALRLRFGAPVRMLNDAIVYGLGVAKGPGRECVLTFGTGMGCALFCDGSTFFGLELGQHYACDGYTYDQFVGHAAYLRIGLDDWNVRVARVIAAVQALTNSDCVFIGGGNSKRITFTLPPWATFAAPSAGVSGGARLWDQDMDRWFADEGQRKDVQTRRQ
jgi:polyphosphate glucokinase